MLRSEIFRLKSVCPNSILLACLFLMISLKPAAGQSRDLASQLEPLIVAHQGEVGVAIRHLATGVDYYYQADRVMPTASLIKFPLMVSAYGKIQRGELQRDRMIRLPEEAKVPGSGILTDHFSPGATLSLRDLIRLMIVYSDNTATNLVAEQVGLKFLNQELQQLGLAETRMNSLVYRRDQSVDPARSQQYGLGSTTARETLQLLEWLEQGKLHSPEICQEMKEHLLVCDDPTKLKRYLPAEVAVAHKSGEVSAARCEAGIIYGKSGAIVVSVLTAENQNREFDDDHPAHLLIGRVAEIAWRHFNPDPPLSDQDPVGSESKFQNVLRNGMGGAAVATLQRTLNARLSPSPDLTVDGDFGLGTEGAVKRFQQENQLAVTGQVDADVWKALQPLIEVDSFPAPEVTNREPWVRQPADDLTGPPVVTAPAWGLFDAIDGTLIAGQNLDQQRQVASTTKIMTAWLVLKLAQQQPALWEERVTFSPRAAATIGSSVNLNEGESVTVEELMYGLLLQSGNDASVALAEHVGHRVAEGIEKLDGFAAAATETDPLKKFIMAMNAEAARLNLTNTNYTNPHGISEENAFGSVRDLATLTRVVWTDPRFRRYVGTPRFGCVATDSTGYRRNIRWSNTNRLLGIENYNGVKTGTTSAAGFCLVTHASRQSQERLIVILGADSNDARYADTRNLARWSWQQGATDPNVQPAGEPGAGSVDQAERLPAPGLTEESQSSARVR